MIKRVVALASLNSLYQSSMSMCRADCVGTTCQAIDVKREIDSSIELHDMSSSRSAPVVPICFDGSPFATGIGIVKHLKRKFIISCI